MIMNYEMINYVVRLLLPGCCLGAVLAQNDDFCCLQFNVHLISKLLTLPKDKILQDIHGQIWFNKLTEGSV